MEIGAAAPTCPRRRERLIGLLRAELGGKTVLLISHDPELVEALADTVAVLDDGRVAWHGSPVALRAIDATPALFREERHEP